MLGAGRQSAEYQAWLCIKLSRRACDAETPIELATDQETRDGSWNRRERIDSAKFEPHQQSRRPLTAIIHTRSYTG